MRQQAQHALALAQREPRLQQPDFLHRQREPARQGGTPDLVQGDPVGRTALRFGCMHALRLQLRQRAAIRGPQQHRIQECGRDRFIGGDPRIRVAQAIDQHPSQCAGLVRRQCLRGFRQQRRQQAVHFEPLETGHRVAGQEQLQGFLEQPRRGGFGQQRRQPRQRFCGGRFDLKIQLCGEPRGAQHAHRILAVARVRIADQAQQARLHVGIAAGVVADREILDRVIQRIGGEVAADRVLLDGSVDVVAQDAAALVHLAVALDIAATVGAEGRDFDDLAAVHHVRQAEAAADQAAVAEQALDLLRGGAGGHVEILGRAADQQVAHSATHQECAETCFAQSIQHAQGIRAHLLA